MTARVPVTLFVLAAAFASATTALSGCGASSSGDGAAAAPLTLSASNADIYAKVYKPTCGISNTCHVGNDSSGRLDLTGQDAVPPTTKAQAVAALLINKPSPESPGEMLIVPGHPEQSYVLRKLQPGAMKGDPNSAGLSCDGQPAPQMTQGNNGCGDLMPQAQSTWSDRQTVINALSAWIAAGADPNN